MKLEFHPISNIFPLLRGSELDILTEDIGANGLISPIILFDGKILDGRNRALACERAGVEIRTIPFEETESGGDPNGRYLRALSFAWSANRARRQLSSSQIAVSKAMYDQFEEDGKRALESLKADARKRQQSNIPQKGQKGFQPVVSQLIDQPLPDPNENRTTAIRAKESGTNRTYLEFADKLVKEHPEIAETIRDGNLQISTAMRKVKTEEVVKKGLERRSCKPDAIHVAPWRQDLDPPMLLPASGMCGCVIRFLVTMIFQLIWVR